MAFFADKQTLDDLNIFNKKAGKSIYGFFNRTRTGGGAEILEQMFRYPLSNAADINRRSKMIRFFKEADITFPFKTEWFDAVSYYLNDDDERSRLEEKTNKWRNVVNKIIGADTHYKQVHKGVQAVIEILNTFYAFLDALNETRGWSVYYDQVISIDNIINDPLFKQMSKEKPNKLVRERVSFYDNILRFQKKDDLKKLLWFAYQLDVYITVAKVATDNQFVFPIANANESEPLLLEGLFHPLVENAKGNDLTMAADKNVLFLTGANMAGKSTFMKSIGIAMFLAHMGFPVPAKRMLFPVLDGIFSTINLPDNINMGYSHFYAEVLRVRRVAEQLSLSKKLFVLFDELFRGTNVKDAYEATVALLASFTQKKDSLFVISTHIIEAGEQLQKENDSTQFVYLPTKLDGTKVIYTYQLEEGITGDRHGMRIIRNEGIVEILENKKPGNAAL